MKDQYVINDGEPQEVKWSRGLDLFIESVLKPDPQLRQCAHNQKCYHELMWVRENILEHLKTCLLYTSPSPRDLSTSRMPSSA